MKACCVAALLVLVSLPAPSPAQQPFVLMDGTPVRVRLNRNVSSAEAKVGDPVDFDVVEDILVNGAIVIQRGSRVLATVTEAKSKGWMGKSGKLDVNVDHARSILGEKIALRAVKENQGSDTGKSGNLVTSVVTAPLSLFMRGQDVTIPKGTEVTAYVHGDVRLDEARIRAHPLNAPAAEEAAAAAPPAANEAPATAPPTAPAAAQAAAPADTPPPQTAPPAAARPPAPAARAGMTNADVLSLKAAGFSDELIISKIKSSRCAFRLDTSDLIELKTAGLSERVIAAMMEKAQ